MKKAFLVLLFAGAALLAYRQLVLEPPVRTFRRFAEAWAKEDTPAAAALTDGEAAKKTVESRILRGVVHDPMEALHGSRLEIESRTGQPDGAVEITALQSVAFDPPGITSAIGGAAVAEVRHVARLRRTAAGWRVVEWTPAFLQSRSTRPGR
jgi:hypothetical protein